MTLEEMMTRKQQLEQAYEQTFANLHVVRGQIQELSFAIETKQKEETKGEE